MYQNSRALLGSPGCVERVPLSQDAGSLPSLPPFTWDSGLSYNDALALVYRERGRDNHVWCLDALRTVLNRYPTGEDAHEMYAYLRGKLQHLESPEAYYALGKYRGDALLRTGDVHRGAQSVRYAVLRAHVACYLADEAPPGATLVEIAFGTGDIPVMWVEVPGIDRVVALDMSAAHLQIADRHFPHPKVSHLAMMAEHLPLADSVAAVTVLAGLLEHVPDADAVLAEAERITSPGGLIAINVPEGGMDWYNPEARARTYFDHVRTFDLPALLSQKRDPVLHCQPYRSTEIPGRGQVPPPPWAVWDNMREWLGSYIVEKEGNI